ncbi:MAG TPA: hypothetical protein VFS40_14730 [Gemmatimonadales bacterium]|nr:hypothetical protein [Gemmatimonadales bacterium]
MSAPARRLRWRAAAPVGFEEPAPGATLAPTASDAALAPEAALAPAVAGAVLLLAALWLGALLFARWPLGVHPMIYSDSPIDASFFTYAGAMVRHGGVPYLSFWDHKPPLIFFIDAAALALGGGSLWGVWAVAWLSLVTALLLAYRALRLAFGPFPALLGALFLAAAAPSILAVNMTEGYAPPLQWLAILLFLWWARGGSTVRAGLGLGVVGALLGFLRPNLIGAPLVAVALMSVRLLAARRGREWLGLVGGGVLGGLVVAAPILGYLAAHGALDAFRDQVLRYNGLYVAASWKRRLRAGYGGLGIVGRTAPVLLPLAGWLLAVARLVRVPVARRDSLVWLGVVWLPVEAVLAGVSGRSYGHYFMPLFAPLAYLAASFAASLLAWRDGPVAPRWAVAALAVALAVPPVLNVALDVYDKGLPHRRADQLQATVGYIDAHTSPRQPILVWGHAADVYYFSGRRPASKYIYPLPLLTPRYATAAMVSGFLAEVRAARPPLIVDATSGVRQWNDLVPSLGAFDPTWRVPPWRSATPWWSMTPALRRFYDYVAAYYEPADTVGPSRWVVYRLRPDGPLDPATTHAPVRIAPVTEDTMVYTW